MNATNLQQRDDKRSEDKAGREGVKKQPQRRWPSSVFGRQFGITEPKPKLNVHKNNLK